ncbi:MAG: hypothetical protein GPOALKHO_000846 [Sodalis sp.]|uniref:cell envelope integrity protein TolA n=1 Tax=Sodalis sp. (in: enterobacteria) TaxID=1898979 RepID=UPI003873B7F8|nr:MAG: hypothetical protein GPOALKHO_000846 [Sodalis sp.]
MLKATEQNDKFKRAIILSIALHCILIAVLIWSSIHQPQESSAGGRSSINAVMVDPDAVVQQHNRQQQTDVQQEEKLRQKQAAEKQRLKALKKQRLAAQEAVEAQQRNQTEQQKQAQEVAKQQAEMQAQQAAVEAKKQAGAEAKQAVVADAKVDQVVKDKKAPAAKKVARRSSDVDALLGSLTEAENVLKVGGSPAGAGKAKQSGASGAEINAYKAQVSRAISDKFYDSSSYSGKMCDLRIKLAHDGLLISVTAVGGDPALCQAAVSAAKLATIPRPPSPQVYEVFKNATLGFSPQ